MSKIACLAHFLFAALGAASAQAPPGIDQIMNATRYGAPAISSDGSLIAYTHSVAAGDGSRTSLIHIVNNDGRLDRELTDGSAPAFSPDDSRVAFFSSRSGSRQIWMIPAGGGEARPITAHQGFIDRFRWSPDGQGIAFLARGQDEADLRYFVRNRAEGVPTVVDANNLPKNRLWVVELQSRESKAVTSAEFSVGGYEQWFPDGFSWSPDSRRITFSKRPHAKAGSHLSSDIAVVNVESGELKTLTSADGMEGYPRWSPDGDEIAFISTERRDWVTVSHIYVIDARGGKSRKITPEFDEKIKQFFWANGGKSILFAAGQGVSTQIFSVDVEETSVSPLTKGLDVRGNLSVSRDGQSMAFLRQNAESPAGVFYAKLGQFHPTQVAGKNSPRSNWPRIETQVIRWKSFDGMEIEGIVHKPLGYRNGEAYPLLVVPHGGPHGVMTNTFVDGEYRLFAQQGWVVFRPNFRGSGNYGEKFLRANLGGWGLGDYQDVMSGIDHLISIGLVDPERMGISGSSYGGYMTSWTISQTNRFKAAVVGAAITDVPSFIRTTDVPDRFEDYLGEDPKNYLRGSPMNYAENIRTPALIWHGDGDIRVPLTQGRHLYTALKHYGVPTEFVIYHGEAHGLRDPAHQRDLLERKLRWLTKWVLGEEPE